MRTKVGHKLKVMVLSDVWESNFDKGRPFNSYMNKVRGPSRAYSCEPLTWSGIVNEWAVANPEKTQLMKLLGFFIIRSSDINNSSIADVKQEEEEIIVICPKQWKATARIPALVVL